MSEVMKSTMSDFYHTRKRRDAITNPQLEIEFLEEKILEQDKELDQLKNWIIDLGQQYYNEKEKHSYERKRIWSETDINKRG